MSLHSTNHNAGNLPQPEGQQGARRRSQWDDYLKPSDAPEPGSASTAATLDFPGEISISTSRPVRAPALRERALPAASGWTGGSRHWERSPSDPLRLDAAVEIIATQARRAMIAVTGALLILIAADVWSRPVPVPVKSFESVPSEQYGRIDPRQTGLADVRWMVRVGRTLIVRVGETWPELPRDLQVRDLQRLRALDSDCSEIQIYDLHSQLIGEVYANRYHLYL